MTARDIKLTMVEHLPRGEFAVIVFLYRTIVGAAVFGTLFRSGGAIFENSLLMIENSAAYKWSVKRPIAVKLIIMTLFVGIIATKLFSERAS